MFLENLSLSEVIIRLGVAILLGGIIGYERGHSNRPAGFRTHILVCLGATIVSLIQDQLRIDILKLAGINPITSQVLKTDLGRIGAQVVSGIGFLGAGTIMRDKSGIIGGLTTAASIWVTGCLGLSIGWGFYNIAVPSGIAVVIVLASLKKFEQTWIENKRIVKLEVKFRNQEEYNKALYQVYELLKNMNVKVKKFEKKDEESRVIYTLIVLNQTETMDIAMELSKGDYISKVNIL